MKQPQLALLQPLPSVHTCLRNLCRLTGIVCAVSLLHGEPSVAGPTDDFTELSLEELHELSISAASKRAQPVFETPAAVSVVLPSDLRRTGHDSIAEALRLVPGTHVIDILPGEHRIGVRGGNGIQSTKLLVLVDGRSVYGPFYGGVEWANAEIDVEDLSRIEVVRGPGASLWGANAVNGIINVISKDARDTQGGIVSLRGGTGEQASAHFRYGGKLSDATWYRIYATATDTDGMLSNHRNDPQIPYESQRVGLRTDSLLSERFQLTTQVDNLENERTLRGDTSTHSMSSILTRLVGRDVGTGDIQVQLYYDISRDRVGISDYGGNSGLPLALNEDNENVDLDVSHHFHLGPNHDVLWGGGVRWTKNSVHSSDNLYVENPEMRSWLSNCFVQDEITLARELRLTVGAKLEHHKTIGWQPMPNVRLVWLPNSKNALWAAVSKAVRAPSRGEREVLLNLGTFPAMGLQPPVRVEVAGNANFHAEINHAHEIGWRWRPHARFSTDITGYYFDYDHARNLSSTTLIEPGPPLTVVQRMQVNNNGEAYTYGGEASWLWRPSDGWELSGGVSRGVAHTNGITGNPLVSADYAIPDHLAHVTSWWQLPHDWEFSTSLYSVGRIELTNTASQLRLDAQFIWRPRLDVEVAVGIQNATDPDHREAIIGTLSPSADVYRNVYLRLQWKY
jgi:iron complex outermembrane recepter protein